MYDMQTLHAGGIPMFRGTYLVQNMFSNFFSILAFIKLPQDGDNELGREENHSKGHYQGQKCQVWLIFTYFSILISSIEVLPKCILSCSFSEVILVLFSNFNGVH